MSDAPREPVRATAWGLRRLRRDLDFRRVLRTGVRVSTRGLTLWLAANELGRWRMGLRVGRRCGGAVRRNRIKRILREAFRRASTTEHGGLDMVLAPGPEFIATLPAAERVLGELLGRAAERLRARGAAEEGSTR